MRQCPCASKKDGGRYFCISHISRGIYLLQYFIYSLWIYLGDNHLHMVKENHRFQHEKCIYITSKTHANKFYNKLTEHYTFKSLLISCIFQDHIYLYFMLHLKLSRQDRGRTYCNKKRIIISIQSNKKLLKNMYINMEIYLIK